MKNKKKTIWESKFKTYEDNKVSQLQKARFFDQK